MKRLNKNLLLDKNLNFYSKGLIFAVLSILASLANYMLYPGVARTLTISEFKDFSILLATITQIGGLFIALNIISIYIVSRIGEEKAKSPLASIQKSLIIFMIVVFVIYGLVSPLLNSVFDLKDGYLTILLLLTLLFSIPGSVWSGYFQGNGELVRVGLYGVVLAVSKLFLAVLFAVNFGVSGSIIGIFLATIFSLIIFWLLPGAKPPIDSTFIVNKSDYSIVTKYKKILLSSIVVVTILSLLQVLDLVAVTAIFSENIAGKYAGISSLSRIVFYIGFILIWILLPEIAKAKPSHRANLIKKSYLMYILISLFTLIFAAIGAYRLVPLILGDNFSIGRSLLLSIILFQTTITVLTFQSFVLLVLGKISSVYILSSNILISLILCLIFKDSLVGMLIAISIVNLISIIISAICINNCKNNY